MSTLGAPRQTQFDTFREELLVAPSKSLTDLMPLLLCPLCDPPVVLSSPLTLRCGHTLCSSHFTHVPSHTPQNLSPPSTPTSTLPLPPCPIPSCKSNLSTSISDWQLPRHPESRVRYLPAPTLAFNPIRHITGQVAAGAALQTRVDVTVNKILTLVPYVLSRTSNDSFPVHPEAEPDKFSPDFSDAIPGTKDDGVARKVQRGSSDAEFPLTPTPSSDNTLPSNYSQGTEAPWEGSDQDYVRGLHPSSSKFEKELYHELTCEICFGLLWQPVTTPCQHTFCSKCLQRSLDHSTSCPMCRQRLPGDSYFRECAAFSSTSTETGACNQVISDIITRIFPNEYKQRGATMAEEERQEKMDTPIFPLQLCYPGLPVYLNIFEPRYRLMLRRCLSSPHPCFGMIPFPRSSTGSDNRSPDSSEYGTMLEIKTAQMMPDGKCKIETWGTWRFRILERGSLDGYMVAKVEKMDDIEDSVEVDAGTLQADLLSSSTTHLPTDGESEGRHQGSFAEVLSDGDPNARRSDQELVAICHAFLDQLKGEMPWVVQYMDRAHAPMPEDPAQFSFWMAMLLPINEQEKSRLLPIRSPRLRLRLVVHWVERMKREWFHSYATASRSQVVFWWLRNALISAYFHLFFRPRPFFTHRDDSQGRPRSVVSNLLQFGFRGRSPTRNMFVLAGYVVLAWAIARAQLRMRDDS